MLPPCSTVKAMMPALFIDFHADKPFRVLLDGDATEFGTLEKAQKYAEGLRRDPFNSPQIFQLLRSKWTEVT